MPLALFKTVQDVEVKLDNVEFIVHKLNPRIRPKNKERIKIISCFSEFGCEVLGCLYCLPRLLRRYPGQYVIAMGWYGREYLYRHLVDEFWEIKEEYMWLRDYTRAFHHTSTNLKRIEKNASQFGEVILSHILGKYAVSNFCRTCGKFWNEWRKHQAECPACQSTVLVRSVFTDIKACKPSAKRIPKPREHLVEWAKGIVKPNTIGIFARGRKTYGRNLAPEFYVRLIELLRKLGYDVIWLGEKQSTQACPVADVIDFSRSDESRDLEKTLAIVSQLKLTIQFWTASTRLAGIMGIPFLLFESPEQIYSSYSGIMSAQEGKRLELCSFGPKKLVMCHYNNVVDKPDDALNLVERALGEMNEGDYEDIIGMVENSEFSSLLKEEFYQMLT